MLLEGRHFRLDQCSAYDVGRKAMGVNLSDIAAMAGTPRAAVVAVALPLDRAEEIARELHRGLASLGHKYGVALVGGDTNAWDGPLVVSVTLYGEAHPRGSVLRAGARPGDRIAVTGPMGGSILGRHLEPIPRLAEARSLQDAGVPRAMIDISDGLASDLGHILKESGGLGATLEVSRIPIHRDAYRLAETTGRPPLEHALTDGEDFELVAVLDPATRWQDWTFLTPVGTIDAEPGIRLRFPDGRIEPFTLRGFDHLAADHSRRAAP
jgi:thiamine-monophosphate kinase